MHLTLLQVKGGSGTWIRLIEFFDNYEVLIFHSSCNCWVAICSACGLQNLIQIGVGKYGKVSFENHMCELFKFLFPGKDQPKKVKDDKTSCTFKPLVKDNGEIWDRLIVVFCVAYNVEVVHNLQTKASHLEYSLRWKCRIKMEIHTTKKWVFFFTSNMPILSTMEAFPTSTNFVRYIWSMPNMGEFNFLKQNFPFSLEVKICFFGSFKMKSNSDSTQDFQTSISSP